MGLTSLERFGDALEDWFGREEVPLWVTGADTRHSPEELGVPALDQARYAREALGAAVGNPRVRMLVWFVLRDSPGNPWQSGLIDQSGELKPAFHTFRGAASSRRTQPESFPWDRARHRACARARLSGPLRLTDPGVCVGPLPDPSRCVPTAGSTCPSATSPTISSRSRLSTSTATPSSAESRWASCGTHA